MEPGNGREAEGRPDRGGDFEGCALEHGDDSSTSNRDYALTKRYTNGAVTVIWQPDLCQHSGICARGLPKVFNPTRRPWIELEHADTPSITALVDKCPSGALTWAKAKNA